MMNCFMCKGDLEEITRPTIMEVNLKNFEYNIQQIREKVGNNVEIMPIIKANAYGTYINTKLDVINKFNIVGVATVDEGVYLRNIGYNKDIFVLNQAAIAEIDKIISNNLIIGVSSNAFIEELGKMQEKVKIHIEIGSGMGRTGINPNRSEEFVNKILEYNNIIIDGIYTHLSSADTDDEYTKKQLNSFKMAVEKIKNNVNTIRYIHSAASNAILNYPESYYNLVRPGMIMYGYESGEGVYKKINIKPVATLKSRIVLLKEVKKGTSIGYGRSYITKKDTIVATIPIGYADGFRRILSNKWYVYINGKKAPIIGKICMDGFMADVTDIPDVKQNDEVIIWDNKNITLDQIAEQCDTINYEIISTISPRVPRVFKK